MQGILVASHTEGKQFADCLTECVSIFALIVFSCLNLPSNVFKQMRAYTRIHARFRAGAHILTRIHTHTHTHKHKHIYTHTHTCTRIIPPPPSLSLSPSLMLTYTHSGTHSHTHTHTQVKSLGDEELDHTKLFACSSRLNTR